MANGVRMKNDGMKKSKREREKKTENRGGEAQRKRKNIEESKDGRWKFVKNLSPPCNDPLERKHMGTTPIGKNTTVANPPSNRHRWIADRVQYQLRGNYIRNDERGIVGRRETKWDLDERRENEENNMRTWKEE
ncbi:hypothetical protein RUM44_007124 [Polyplax serrata]|uniref:Uncharacterized protein n=1 Tax=Polyplax serrata TaxID=468196 RepID=A0ABR1AZU8_POLSC